MRNPLNDLYEALLVCAAITFAMAVVFGGAPYAGGAELGEYVVDYNDRASVERWLDDAGFALIKAPDDKMRLFCAWAEVINHRANPDSVVTLGQYDTNIGPKPICLSDAVVGPGLGLRTCRAVGKHFIRVDWSKVVCRNKVT